jgi:hypothetical protein
MRWWRITIRISRAYEEIGTRRWDRTILSSGTTNGGTEPDRDLRQFSEQSFIYFLLLFI